MKTRESFVIQINAKDCRTLFVCKSQGHRAFIHEIEHFANADRGLYWFSISKAIDWKYITKGYQSKTYKQV